MRQEKETVADAVAQWDNGLPVRTVELGGLGPGYEQAIQILVMELLRDEKDHDLPVTREEQEKWGEATITRTDEWVGGYSGAQVGAAKSLAYRMLRDGYEETIESMRQHDADRVILVAKRFPGVPEEV